MGLGSATRARTLALTRAALARRVEAREGGAEVDEDGGGEAADVGADEGDRRRRRAARRVRLQRLLEGQVDRDHDRDTYLPGLTPFNSKKASSCGQQATHRSTADKRIIMFVSQQLVVTGTHRVPWRHRAPADRISFTPPLSVHEFW